MRLRSTTLAAFVGPCLPIAGVGLPLVVYLPPYYAGELGLPLATVGLIFFLTRLVDLPVDPALGHLIDRTATRVGRYRPWLAAGALVMMLAAAGVFMAAPGVSAAAAFGWLALMYLGYSMMALSHQSWGATLSDDYHERSRVYGWWQAANVFAMILILLLPPIVGRLAPGDGAGPGVRAMGWFVILTLPVTVAIAAWTVRERPRVAGLAHPDWADIWRVLANPLMRRLLWVDALMSLAPGITGALFVFFFERARMLSPEQTAVLLLVYFVAGLACVPLWTWAAKRWSKHRAMAVACACYAASQFLVLAIPAGAFGWALAGMALAGVPYAAAAFLVRAMLADVVDAETERDGADRTGVAYALVTVTQKVGYAVPVGLTYPVLAWIGFAPAPGAVNTDAALRGLELLFVTPSAVLALGAAALLWRWPLGADAHGALRERLAARG